MGSDRSRGSVLMLMPAAVLVLLILAAIAVDSSARFAQQRELVSAAQAAANDAATYAVDQPDFYAGTGLRHDRSRLEAVVARSLRARGVQARVVARIVDDGIVIELVGEATLVFAEAVPGFDPDQTIRARASAQLILR